VKAEQIFSDLKKKIYYPVYLLTGDEPFYIDKITEYILKTVLTEEEKSFNEHIFYGKDTDVATVINTAKRFPMMAAHQTVIVKEAQHLKDIDNLIYYVEKPLKSTILVINYKYKKVDKRKKLYKAIQDSGVIMDSQKLYEDKIPTWIAQYLHKRGFQVEPRGAVMLTEFLGNDLGKIVNELEKLVITNDSTAKKITANQIEKNIGISKDYNNFELTKALTTRKAEKAFAITSYFGKNQKNNPIILTISSLYYFFSKVLMYHFVKDKTPRNVASMLKVNPYFVKDYESAAKVYSKGKLAKIIALLREYDLKSKGVENVSSAPGDLLKELVYKILN